MRTGFPVFGLLNRKGKFIWIEREVDGFAVIAPDAQTVLKMCKTWASALRWVTMHIVEIMMEG